MGKLTPKDIENYQRTKEVLNKFCNRFVTNLYVTDNRLCYPIYEDNDFFINENNIYICTQGDQGNYKDNMYIEVPLSVFYNDNMIEHINKLYNEKLKKEEEEKRRIYEQNRQSAIETIRELKKKYNIN